MRDLRSVKPCLSAARLALFSRALSSMLPAYQGRTEHVPGVDSADTCPCLPGLPACVCCDRARRLSARTPTINDHDARTANPPAGALRVLWRGIVTDRVITLADLAGCDFATVGEAAQILRADPRTIRRRIADGTIPATRAADWRVPVAWLRQQASAPA